MLASLLLTAILGVAADVRTYPVPGNRVPSVIVRHGDALRLVAWTRESEKKDEQGQPPGRAYFARVTTRGRFGRFSRLPEGSGPLASTRTPDGTVWFTDVRQDTFWRISKEGRITRVPGRKAHAISYAAGDLWCSHDLSAWISRHGLDGSRKGGVAVPDDVPPPMTSSLPPPGPLVASLTTGPDGALWFTDWQRARIGRLTPGGELTLYASPAPVAQSGAIVAGPDQTLWYTTANVTQLGRITTSGVASIVEIGFFRTGGLAADSQGRIWYFGGDRAGLIDRDGTRQEFAVPGARDISSMTEGPDGAMWFADRAARTIGRIELRAR